MLIRLSATLIAFSLALPAANVMAGTWKLDTAKSKYSGIPKMKEATVTYMEEGSGWRYESKGTREDGQPSTTSFLYVKDGEDIKLPGSALGDTVVLRNADAKVATGDFKRDGKVIGNVKRTISADGKTMTVSGKTLTSDGKKVSYTSVYTKQ